MRKSRKEAAAEARIRVNEKLKEKRKKSGEPQTELNVIMPDPEKIFRRLI